jgi:hypothetical protein
VRRGHLGSVEGAALRRFDREQITPSWDALSSFAHFPILRSRCLRSSSRGMAVHPQDGRQGTVESAPKRGDRATAPIEEIWCEKIRGCSYRGGGASYSMSAMPDAMGPRPCENANTLNRDRSSYSFKVVLAAHMASPFNFEVELKNIILAALRVFEFSHRLGQMRT